MDIYNQSWIGRSMTITSSTDATLTGRQGIVSTKPETPLFSWRENTTWS